MPEQPQARLILFPGLGLSAPIYRPQQGLPLRVEVPSWPQPRAGESLTHYAQRWAGQLDPTPPLYLGGLSMGGCLALEAGRVLRPRGIFLIASAFTGQAIAPWVRALLRLASIAPITSLAAALHLAPLLLRFVGRPDRRQRRLLLEVAAHIDLPILRWGAAALLDWEFQGSLPAPVYQTHGCRDWLVPLNNVRPDEVLDDGHALNVTRAEAVNRFICHHIQGDWAHLTGARTSALGCASNPPVPGVCHLLP